MPTHFDKALFRFLGDLKKNNDRAWFKANKSRYIEVLRDPALRFISDAEAPLMKLSTEFRADAQPSGGSLFRIYNDTRFHKNKPPYKTHVGFRFLHADGEDVHAPVYYLQLAPKDCFVALGIWRPEPKVAQQIRRAILARPKEWKRAAHGKRFSEAFVLGGESLKRPPSLPGVKDLAEDDALLVDVKRKSFMASSPLRDEDAFAPDFMKTVFSKYRLGTAFMKFLCEAVELPY